MNLSVVVCAYNTKKEYLDECLKSIKNSTLQDYEILLIDDGSSKDYRELAHKYEARLVKTENRGQLATRLLAIDIAKGDYMTFVDSDDTVSFNYHMPMVELAKKENADIVINDWAFNTKNAKYSCKWEKNWQINWENEACLSEFAKNQGKSHAYFVFWNKVVSRKLYKVAKTELEKTDAIMHKITFSEDALVSFFLFKNAKKVVNTHTGYYFYRIHEGQTVSKNSFDALKNQIENMSVTFNTMLSFCDGEIKENILKWREMMARTHYSYAKEAKLEELYPLIKEKYEVQKLETAKMSDSEKYLKHNLLPDNFEFIDKELYGIYKSEDSVTVFYDLKDEYVCASLAYIDAHKKTNEGGKMRTFVVPKATNSFKNKLLHSSLVTTLGALLFKKGSSARARLKSSL